jgi:hypothetical protein
MKGGRPRMAVISLKQAHDAAKAQQIAHGELQKLQNSGRPYFIHVTDTSDISQATRQAKAKYLFDSQGDIDGSTDRAYHPDVNSP